MPVLLYYKGDMITHVLVSFIGNGAALYLAALLVDNFNLDISTGWQAFAALVLVFTFINLVIKPLLRFFLGPLIVLTLGLFNLVINAAVIFIVDKYSEHLSITGLPALVYGTLIITAVNVVIHTILHRHQARSWT